MNTSPSSVDRSESACTGAEIRLERVSVAFGEHRIVSDINLHVAAGEFVCLLGQAAAENRHCSISWQDFCRPHRERSLLVGSRFTGPEGTAASCSRAPRRCFRGLRSRRTWNMGRACAACLVQSVPTRRGVIWTWLA